MERLSLEWLNMRSRGLAVLIVVALLMPLIPISNAQNPIFGVQLTCEDLPDTSEVFSMQVIMRDTC